MILWAVGLITTVICLCLCTAFELKNWLMIKHIILFPQVTSYICRIMANGKWPTANIILFTKVIILLA